MIVRVSQVPLTKNSACNPNHFSSAVTLSTKDNKLSDLDWWGRVDEAKFLKGLFLEFPDMAARVTSFRQGKCDMPAKYLTSVYKNG
jgi:hypothetical protein